MFEKGHPAYPSTKLPPSSERRRGARSLAMRLREDSRNEELYEALWSMALGIDPTTHERLDVKRQIDAMKIVLERQWGMPAQHTTIEADVRQAMIQLAPTHARPTMTLEQINARREALRAAGVRPKVIDVEQLETAKLESGDDNDSE